MTLLAASNYANSLFLLERCEEGKALLRKTMPVARRVLGESDKVTLRMRSNYATALYTDPSARLDDLRDAVVGLGWRRRRRGRVVVVAVVEVAEQLRMQALVLVLMELRADAAESAERRVLC